MIKCVTINLIALYDAFGCGIINYSPLHCSALVNQLKVVTAKSLMPLSITAKMAESHVAILPASSSRLSPYRFHGQSECTSDIHNFSLISKSRGQFWNVKSGALSMHFFRA